ncbi:cupin domain-containing protein [Poritiphilus flavus]|uniref:Cupin domain-containing protein n=1 Tax=Poritiphilus flavus TaxID=2697053 RepID=A0A6L9EC89_9FLAO|nr:cupin domain-containing protein [Poritiphilus flavus]NAS12221.1 cupin domain-containing protein [Poritiphilus flavus]
MKNLIPLLIASLISLNLHAQYSGEIKVVELLDAETNAIGQKIEYPNFDSAKVTIRKVIFPPGSDTGWHKHEMPVFSYILSGTLTVEVEDRKSLEYSGGESFAESIGIYHRGINKTDDDVEIIAIYLGGDQQQLSIARPEE